jgi:hypothetical protein
MTRAIHLLKQDLAALEAEVSSLSQTLQGLYRKYLELLSQSAQKQLILASYQLCTQAYPESFLELSFHERQKFQENLKILGEKLQIQLLHCLKASRQSQENDPLDMMAQMISQFSPSDSSLDQATEFSQESQELSENITNPDVLMRWCKQVEKAIHATLEQISGEVNKSFQKAKIVPQKLPNKILEMAMQNEESGTITSSPPNLLQLLVEAEEEDSEDDSLERNIAKITAIRLRLPEIEFADPNLNNGRNQIHNLLEKLRILGKQYHKKQRECNIVEAENAWRSSWYEN